MNPTSENMAPVFYQGLGHDDPDQIHFWIEHYLSLNSVRTLKNLKILFPLGSGMTIWEVIQDGISVGCKSMMFRQVIDTTLLEKIGCPWMMMMVW